MSKRKQARKAVRERAEARKMTSGKLLRLIGKSMLFAVTVAFIILGLNLAGVPAFGNFYVQLGVMFVVYMVAYPFLMSEFRPKRKDIR